MWPVFCIFSYKTSILENTEPGLPVEKSLTSGKTSCVSVVFFLADNYTYGKTVFFFMCQASLGCASVYICTVKKRMAPYCSHMLTVAFGLLLLAITSTSVKGLPPGLEFKSFNLCGKILHCKSEPEQSLSQINVSVISFLSVIYCLFSYQISHRQAEGRSGYEIIAQLYPFAAADVVSRQEELTKRTCSRSAFSPDWIKGVVSKETVVLRLWGSWAQEFGFINGVDNVNWPLYRDSKSWRFIRANRGIMGCVWFI